MKRKPAGKAKRTAPKSTKGSRAAKRIDARGKRKAAPAKQPAKRTRAKRTTVAESLSDKARRVAQGLMESRFQTMAEQKAAAAEAVAAAQELAPAPLAVAGEFTQEVQMQLQKRALERAWLALPYGVDQVVKALDAKKIITYAGEVTEHNEPDHFVRLQAYDRLHKMTLGPMIEKDQVRPPIIIYNALQGELGNMMMEIGFQGSRSVPLEAVLAAQKSRVEVEAVGEN